jgi:hypothetical protein
MCVSLTVGCLFPETYHINADSFQKAVHFLEDSGEVEKKERDAKETQEPSRKKSSRKYLYISSDKTSIVAMPLGTPGVHRRLQVAEISRIFSAILQSQQKIKGFDTDYAKMAMVKKRLITFKKHLEHSEHWFWLWIARIFHGGVYQVQNLLAGINLEEQGKQELEIVKKIYNSISGADLKQLENSKSSKPQDLEVIYSILSKLQGVESSLKMVTIEEGTKEESDNSYHQEVCKILGEITSLIKTGKTTAATVLDKIHRRTDLSDHDKIILYGKYILFSASENIKTNLKFLLSLGRLKARYKAIEIPSISDKNITIKAFNDNLMLFEELEEDTEKAKAYCLKTDLEDFDNLLKGIQSEIDILKRQLEVLKKNFGITHTPSKTPSKIKVDR